MREWNTDLGQALPVSLERGKKSLRRPERKNKNKEEKKL